MNSFTSNNLIVYNIAVAYWQAMLSSSLCLLFIVTSNHCWNICLNSSLLRNFVLSMHILWLHPPSKAFLSRSCKVFLILGSCKALSTLFFRVPVRFFWFLYHVKDFSFTFLSRFIFPEGAFSWDKTNPCLLPSYYLRFHYLCVSGVSGH